jgi:curved DNA-binding protein CbpA
MVDTHKDNQSKKIRKSTEIVNFYEVLGIENKNATQKEMRAKYTKLAIKYHPDKNKDNSDYNPALFELIQKAWEGIGNPEKRQEYDKLLNNVEKAKKSDHNNLKQSYDEYLELSKSDVTEKSPDIAKLEFVKLSSDMDRKHNFDRKKLKDDPLDTGTTKKRYGDLQLQREQEEIEFSQNRIFGEKDFELGKFNAAYDLYKNTSNKEIVKKTGGPSAFNDMGGATGNFSSLDVFENTYDDNDIEGTSTFASVNFGSENKLDIDSAKLKTLRSADYTSNHNKRSEGYTKDLEKLIQERNNENSRLDNLKYDEFVNDPKEAYMFTHEVGAVDEFSTWDDDDDLIKACNTLIELEKKK